MTERRTSARVSVNLEVEERTAGDLYFQRATNLSITGLYLDGTLPHPPGTQVVLALALPGEPTPVRVRGEVIPPTARPRGMGVKFVSVSAYNRARIAEYLARAPMVA